MAYSPISAVPIQYSKADGTPANGYYLKFYLANSSTPISMQTDSGGATSLAKAKLNEYGYPISNPNDENTVFIPHLSTTYTAYRFVLYASAADADANNVTSGLPNIQSVEINAAATLTDELRADLAASSGASLVGFIQSGAGPVARTVQSKLRDFISVKDFSAVGNGIADDTVAIQSAINYASQNGIRTVYFPSGTYNFSRIYCYYDAVLNPGYNINRNAKITLIGDGTLPEVDGTAGTILNSTVTTGDCFIVSGLTEDASPYRSRDFNIRDITLQGETSGYLMVLGGVITPHLEYVKLIQYNAAGSGLRISTSFFATLEKMQFANYGAGTKTGDAIRFSTTLFAGLFTMRDCNINGFSVGLYKENGGWQNVSIYDTEIAASTFPIYIGTGTLDVLNIQGCYFEGNCQSFINVFPEFGLNTLNISGSWFYSQGLTGTAINLRRMGAVNISGCYVLNQYTEFLNIDNSITGYNNGAFSVNGLHFTYTGSNPTTDVYYFVGNIIPALYSVDYPKSVAYCHLYTAQRRPIEGCAQFGAIGSWLSAGHVFSSMLYNIGPANGNTINLQGISSGCPAYVTGYFVTTPSTIVLPAVSSGIPHGFNVTVTSAMASSTTVNINRDPADGGATLGTLSAGQQKTFVFFDDGTLNNWL